MNITVNDLLGSVTPEDILNAIQMGAKSAIKEVMTETIERQKKEREVLGVPSTP